LTSGEAEIMPTRIRSKVGVTPDEALALVPEARRIANLYPNDAVVLSALAEAELDAGFDDAAIAAADRALALDPKLMNAHIRKGYALTNKVKSGALPPEAWKEVRSQWVKANRIENDHPIPLVQNYLSYLVQGIPPTPTSIQGLEWAMVLAPFDPALRWTAAQRMISDGRLADAAKTLAPLAYSPHPGEHTDKARQLLGEVEVRIAEQATAAGTVGRAD
jgi:tetratricopeptide (TPR) repeat protein